MSMILELIGGRKTLYGVVVGFLVGLLVGWFAIGWGIAPLAWKDAAPVDLHPTYQKEFVKALADSYSLHGQAELAKALLSERWENDDLAKLIGELKAEASDDQVQRLDALAQALGIPTAAPLAGTTPTPEPTSEGATNVIGRLLPICGTFLVVVAALALAGLVVRIIRRGRPEEEEVDTLARMEEAISPAIAGAMPTGTVLGHFITSYALGNDHYDESFSIETEGDFLGECGVGIGETIGVGPPDKVTALEVWLFDKNAIRTETKVVMSAHAFNDEDLRSKLAPRGDPVLAEPGKLISLETTDLRVTAQITEMQYSMNATPPQSFFERITFELVVSLKEAGERTQTEASTQPS
jgi:hypothetical protein